MRVASHGPSVRIVFPTEGAFWRDSAIDVSGQAFGVGLAAARLTTDAGFSGEASIGDDGTFRGRVTLDREGPIKISAVVRDALKRESEVFSVTVVRDMRAPEIALTAPIPGVPAITSRSEFLVRGIVTDANLLSFKADDGTSIPVGEGGTFEYRWRLPRDGQSQLGLVATDKAGNAANVFVVVTRDTVAPTMQLDATSFAAGQPIPLAGTLSKDGCAVLIDGAPAQVAGTHFEKQVALGAGTHTVLIEVTDAAGNKARYSASIVVSAAVAPAVAEPRVAPGLPLPIPGVRRGAVTGDYVCESDGATMVFVPRATFPMGSDEDDTEKPIHEVTVSPFYIDKTEVTVGEFGRFVAARHYTTDAETGGGQLNNGGGAVVFGDRPTRGFWPTDGASWRNPGYDQNDDDPVACVTWHDAEE
ncbi:MAG: SUMF1/EgtB/PvdO family nonheme iron enzyme, partial [Polyangiaceae bacterium]